VRGVRQLGCCEWLDGGECGGQCSSGEKRLVIEGIVTGVIARNRRTVTWAKWEERKKLFD
jgi:hypothetical protein